MLRSPEEARRLVLAVLGEHAESLLSVARRHSLCLDDAHDAYQRAVEIFLRHASSLEAAEAHKWLHTVTKHEAMAVRGARLRTVGGEEVDLDAREADDLPSPDEQVLRFERMTRSAEALRRLKPNERQALWLRAQGHSYAEIAELCDWTYTKVNRCITEGRRTFLSRFEGIETGAECRRWEPLLSAMADGEAGAAELAQARPHLRNCPACRATVRELRETNAGLAALLPVPVVVAGASAVHRHVEAAGGMLARVHDAIASVVQERVVEPALRLQTGIEAAGAAKVATIAASAAAIAGGGVAVQQAVVQHRRPSPHHARASRLRAPRAAAAAVPHVPPRPAPLLRRVAAPRRAPATRTSTRRAEFHLASHPRARAASSDTTAAREFSPPPAATEASVAPAPRAPGSTAARTEAREFAIK